MRELAHELSSNLHHIGSVLTLSSASKSLKTISEEKSLKAVAELQRQSVYRHLIHCLRSAIRRLASVIQKMRESPATRLGAVLLVPHRPSIRCTRPSHPADAETKTQRCTASHWLVMRSTSHCRESNAAATGAGS